MKKVDKKELSQALMTLYSNTEEFNRIGGKSILPEFEDSQKGVTLEECKETVLALIDRDAQETIDGLIDICVTASFMVMILDKNNSITKSHLAYFNVDGQSKEVLAGNLLTAILKEKWIDVLEIAEDLLYTLDENAIYNINQVSTSNMSKFVPITALDDPDSLCDTIESEGRYTGVEYRNESLQDGTEVYVFTATYDVKEKRAFDKPKIVKPTGFFQEPKLKV